jgi:hypothetical protein
VSVAEIDSTLQAKLNLKLLNVPASSSLLELNCNGLSFCSQGGTGRPGIQTHLSRCSETLRSDGSSRVGFENAIPAGLAGRQAKGPVTCRALASTCGGDA